MNLRTWAKSRDGSTHQIYNDMSSSDITDSNPNGIWTSDNSDGGWDSHSESQEGSLNLYAIGVGF